MQQLGALSLLLYSLHSVTGHSDNNRNPVLHTNTHIYRPVLFIASPLLFACSLSHSLSILLLSPCAINNSLLSFTWGVYLIGGTKGTVMVDSPLVVESTIATWGSLKMSVSTGKIFHRWKPFGSLPRREFMLNHRVPVHTTLHRLQTVFKSLFLSVSHLPEAFKLPLFDAEQLAGLSADNGSVAWRVVQDRLPERCPNPQCADRDCILHTNTIYWIKLLLSQRRNSRL